MDKMKELLWEAFCLGFNANRRTGDSEVSSEKLKETYWDTFEIWFNPTPKKTPYQLVQEWTNVQTTRFADWDDLIKNIPRQKTEDDVFTRFLENEKEKIIPMETENKPDPNFGPREFKTTTDFGGCEVPESVKFGGCEISEKRLLKNPDGFKIVWK